MGTDGACGLLFCAAKRSGAFPPNMPAGLRARVSRLDGFTRPTASPVMTKSWGPSWGRSYYPENGLMKPPKRGTRVLSPAGMFGGKAPLSLAEQKSRPHAPSVPMRSAPAYFLCKWGVYTRLD